MLISMIAALATNRVIGFHNNLPWHMPADMRHFMKTTMGKPIIMGRKTFESFGSKPLPGRQNIILTHNEQYPAVDCAVCTSTQAAIKLASNHSEVMIIGGASIYEQFLPQAGRLYLTFINAPFEGDSHFPKYEQYNWREVSRKNFDKDEKNSHAYSFIILERE